MKCCFQNPREPKWIGALIYTAYQIIKYQLIYTVSWMMLLIMKMITSTIMTVRMMLTVQLHIVRESWSVVRITCCLLRDKWSLFV